MRAAFYEGHEKIRIGDCAPLPPGKGQVQIQVSHCGICGTDLHVFHGKMDHRVTFPQVIGHEMSGTITAAGEGVSGWAAGDRVTVRPLDPCGNCPACRAGHSHICQKLKFIGIDAPGALQGLWTVPAHTLHRLPRSLSFEQGANRLAALVAGTGTRAASCRWSARGPPRVRQLAVASNRGARAYSACPTSPAAVKDPVQALFSLGGLLRRDRPRLPFTAFNLPRNVLSGVRVVCRQGHLGRAAADG